jgi:polyhydroxybutyrate depolymerase
MRTNLLSILFIILVIPGKVWAQQTIKGIFQHKGLEREYLYYAPENLPENAPPLVVLHGFTGSAEQIMNYTQMNNIAQANNFAVVYPQGTRDNNNKTFWNVGYDFHKNSKVDDVDFIVQLAHLLQEKYQLSVKNTFVTGMSNGGDMSYLLACRHPGVFAAIAPVVGTMMQSYFKTAMPKNPVPVLAINGTNDSITSYNGDMENKEGWGAYQSVPFIINFWAEAIEYKAVKTDTLPDYNDADSSYVISTNYLNPEKQLEVLFYKVVNGGHDWPGASGNRDINASKEIGRFFKKYIH